MHQDLISMLLCPHCMSDLRWDVGKRDDESTILEADADCPTCGATYQVREGIGAFLTPDLGRTDLWEESYGHLAQFLNANHEIRAQLIDSSLDELDPVDRFLRSEYLEERGDFAGAERARRGTGRHLYTPEMNAVMDACTARLTELIPGDASPVVDVASGRGTMIEPMVERGLSLIVSTDYSLRVLRRSRRRLQHDGVDGTVSHLVVDARKTPFRDRSIPTLVSHMGIANILDGAGEALAELRRVCRGSFLFTHMFCQPDDPDHAPILRKSGHPLAFLDEGLKALCRAGWDVEVIVKERVPIRPTPSSTLAPDMTIDAFPLTETEFDFALLRAR